MIQCSLQILVIFFFFFLVRDYLARKLRLSRKEQLIIRYTVVCYKCKFLLIKYNYSRSFLNIFLFSCIFSSRNSESREPKKKIIISILAKELIFYDLLFLSQRISIHINTHTLIWYIHTANIHVNMNFLLIVSDFSKHI